MAADEALPLSPKQTYQSQGKKRDHSTPVWSHHYGEDRPQSHHSHPRSRWVDFHETSGPPIPSPPPSRQKTPSEKAPALSSNGHALLSTPISREEALRLEPDYSQPWGRFLTDEEKSHSGPKKVWYKRLEQQLLRGVFIPLLLRLTVWTFSLIGLGLAASILSFYAETSGVQPTASPTIAIVINAIALIYLVWITWDEYTGKPIGLRSARAKIRLLLLDLVFIVFQGANLSLQFEAATDNGSCAPGLDAVEQQVCPSSFQAVVLKVPTQRALASVILIALIAWLMTFAISVLRVIERASNSGT